jgi:hypothetical protein
MRGLDSRTPALELELLLFRRAFELAADFALALAHRAARALRRWARFFSVTVLPPLEAIGGGVGDLFWCHRPPAERADFGANLTEFFAGLAHN